MNTLVLKNKLIGLVLILFGALSVWVCDGDATFCVFTSLIGLGLLFTKATDYSDFD